VDFDASAHGVTMRLTLDAMHDERWTEMARRGFDSQFGRLADVVGPRLPNV
jgi:hypothetical protein